MPVTQDPLEWLMALMNMEGVRLKLRVDAAKTLMAYFHRQR